MNLSPIHKYIFPALIVCTLLCGCEARQKSTLKFDFWFADLMPAPATVSFKQTYEHFVSYDWDFGDGSAHSKETMPAHTYEKPGRYRVIVTASDRGRKNRLEKMITIGPPLKKKIYITRIILNSLNWKNSVGNDWDTGTGPELFPYAYMTDNIGWYNEKYKEDVTEKDLPLVWTVTKQEPFYKDWQPEIRFYDYDFGDQADVVGVIHLQYNTIPQTDTIYNVKEDGLDVTLHLRFE